MNLANATLRMLATTLAEAQKTLPQAERATNAPMLTEAALVLVRALHVAMSPPELKMLTPTPNA